MASQVPNAKQVFLDANGFPLVAGTVGMYVPATLIYKNTWQDAGQTVLNTNPIVLDALGSAIIFGSGAYRQVVKDSLGNLIWDQLTYASGAGGGGSTKTLTVSSSPYTMQQTDGVLFCNVSGGAIVIDLLPAAQFGGEVSIKIKGAATNTVSIIANGSDLIDGIPQTTLNSQNMAITLASDLVSYWGSL